eukprot:550602_1
MTTSQTRLSKILSHLDNTASKATEFLNPGEVMDNEIHPIPRIIWTFWNGNPSPIVRLCIDTWKRTNPEWKIILLNENNVNEYILKSDLPKYWDYYSGQYARLTDFMRLYLLCKYGGAWLDASIILNKKLTDIFPLNNKKYEFWGGYADHNMSPSKSFIVTPESWLLISRPGNKFICLWYDEFYYYLNNYSTTNKYITYLKHQKHVNWSISHYPLLHAYVTLLYAF